MTESVLEHLVMLSLSLILFRDGGGGREQMWR
jgi:hypothetical protein